jgi:hypothetical protein
MRSVILAGLLTLAFHPALAERLKPETVAAFDHYVAVTEQRMAGELKSGAFLKFEMLPAQERADAVAQLKNGEVNIERLETLDHNQKIPVPSGLIHHWMGTIFIPGVSLAQTLTFLQDYDNHSKFYAPDVQRSKLISRKGNDFKVFLRLRKTKIVTVILDTQYDVKYTALDAERETSNSYSTRIAEVENAGKANESEKPVGNDSGFLWRLNSYWRFWQRDGGVYVQLEAISLTRDIPTGLGWLVRPFVTSIPRESLEFTLSRTHAALRGAAKP